MTNIAILKPTTVLQQRISSRPTRDFEVRPIFSAAEFNSEAYVTKYVHSLGEAHSG
jgi:hypothetical protein